jgi:exodeoxyribonuclease V gamma subunit
LIAPWVRLLMACACGVPLQIVLIGRDATLTLSPLDREQALPAAQALLAAWLAGQQAPLPVAPRTALAWLSKPDKAADVYDGGFRLTGEGREPCLAREFPDFDALAADGQFEHWTQTLFEPLARWAAEHLEVQVHEDVAADNEEDAP